MKAIMIEMPFYSDVGVVNQLPLVFLTKKRGINIFSYNYFVNNEKRKDCTPSGSSKLKLQ